jgi:hypothetical protein
MAVSRVIFSWTGISGQRPLVFLREPVGCECSPSKKQGQNRRWISLSRWWEGEDGEFQLYTGRANQMFDFGPEQEAIHSDKSAAANLQGGLK